MALLFDAVREANKAMDGGDRSGAAAAAGMVLAVGKALGFFATRPAAFLARYNAGAATKAGLSTDAIEGLIAERKAARASKDFARSDAIRQDLLDQGIVLEDGAGGTTWRRG